MENQIHQDSENQSQQDVWKYYQERSYEMIGEYLANKLKGEKRTWCEVYNKALILKKKQHDELKDKDIDIYINFVDKLYQEKCYNLVGEELAKKLKGDDEWYAVYYRILRIVEEREMNKKLNLIKKEIEKRPRDELVKPLLNDEDEQDEV